MHYEQTRAHQGLTSLSLFGAKAEAVNLFSFENILNRHS
jgi:hypothetical protein